MGEQLSVARDIKALALINIQDIFRFTITAKDNEIEDRYGSEARAIEVAEKYLDIAMKADVLEYDLKGWSMKYSVPTKGKDERIEKVAYFYDRQTESNDSEIPNNCTDCDCTDDCTECKEAEHGCKDEPQTDCDKGLQQLREIMFDKEKTEQLIKECEAMGIKTDDCQWR